MSAPPSFWLASFALSRWSASSGTASQVMRNEITSAEAMVSDSALKKAPVTPERKASGTKMITVEAEEPASGGMNSSAAAITRPWWSRGAPRSRRTMCSIITMASSMISPTAAAMPPRVMMLKLMPSTLSNTTVEASTAGTTMMAMPVIFRLRRNSSSTSAARPMPMRMASRTLAAAPTTSRLWSYQLAIFKPAGSWLR